MEQFIVTVDKLNKRRIIPSALPDNANISGIVYKGYTFQADQVDDSLIPNKSLGKWYVDSDQNYYWGGGVTLVKPTGTLSIQQVTAATGANEVNASRFLPYLITACQDYVFNTPVRKLCFLAQVGHESGSLHYTEELDSGAAYEGRADLGNSEPGDGIRYKGRGLIQITGRSNYHVLSKSFNVDFISFPEKLGGKTAAVCSPEQLKYATLSAGWFWKNKALNEIADKIDLHRPIDENDNLLNFRLLTRRINGGYNGLADRLGKYKNGQSLFV